MSGPQGNFLPLRKWLPGQPPPTDWPSHIHSPREVTEHEKGCDKHMETKQ